MSLFLCPECGNEISDQAKSCPKCGYRIKKRVSKKKKVISMVCIIIFIFLIIALDYFINREQINAAYVAINEIEEVEDAKTIDSGTLSSILNAMQQYDEVNPFARPFVFNFSKLKTAKNHLAKTPLEVTSENIETFLDIDVAISNYSVDKQYVFGLYQYTETVDAKIQVTPKEDFNFKDFSFTLDLGSSFYDNDRVSVIIEDDKPFVDTRILINDRSLIASGSPFLFIKSSNIKGEIYFK